MPDNIVERIERLEEPPVLKTPYDLQLIFENYAMSIFSMELRDTTTLEQDYLSLTHLYGRMDNFSTITVNDMCKLFEKKWIDSCKDQADD